MRTFFSSYYFRFSHFTFFFLFLLVKKRFVEISSFRFILKEKRKGMTTESTKFSKMKEIKLSNVYNGAKYRLLAVYFYYLAQLNGLNIMFLLLIF